MNNSLVSIIIPTYNRAHLIGETLDSVLAQTYQNWECIIIDDGSTDETDEVINSYLEKDSRFQCYLRPNDRPKGANSCRNYGFELSKGEFINWFDDDDVMLEDFIFFKVNLFKTEQLKMVICSGFYVDENLVEMEKINLKIETFLFKDYVRWKLKIMTPSILFRRNFLEYKNLFDLYIHRGQETELFSRLFYKLPESKYEILNSPLFLYRQHFVTKSSKNKDYVRLYKESHSKIVIENLKKSIELKDLDLIKYYYDGLVDLFYVGLEFRHFKNCFFILRKGISEMYHYHKLLAFQFWVSGYFFICIRRGSYKVEKYFKNYQLK